SPCPECLKPSRHIFPVTRIRKIPCRNVPNQTSKKTNEDIASQCPNSGKQCSISRNKSQPMSQCPKLSRRYSGQEKNRTMSRMSQPLSSTRDTQKPSIFDTP